VSVAPGLISISSSSRSGTSANHARLCDRQMHIDDRTSKERSASLVLVVLVKPDASLLRRKATQFFMTVYRSKFTTPSWYSKVTDDDRVGFRWYTAQAQQFQRSG
jgi:hypothetical protein